MKTYIDGILLNVCAALQLPPEKYTLADERYQTISRIIGKDAAFSSKRINVYPQGSFRHKTTVKPLAREEYDLDFVVELPQNSLMTPKELYDHIARILSNDGIHNDMVEKKNRCIRINYKNDFHMDIMPAKLVDQQSGEIIVPDKTLGHWYHHSNPIKYAEWFESKARETITAEIQKRHFAEMKTEPIEEQEVVTRLEPLRRAVQLIKRYRDIYCEKHNVVAVRSIIISTLMGNISSAYTNTYEIMKDFCKYICDLNRASKGKPFEIKNPVVDEVLTEKWSEDVSIYDGFINMVHALADDLVRLQNMKINSEANKLLKEMFGERIVNAAIIDYSKPIGVARTQGTLAVGASGTLNTKSTGTPVKKNTFYG